MTKTPRQLKWPCWGPTDLLESVAVDVHLGSEHFVQLQLFVKSALRRLLGGVLSSLGAEVVGVLAVVAGDADSSAAARFASVHAQCVTSGEVLLERHEQGQRRGVLQLLLPLPSPDGAAAFVLFMAPWAAVCRCLLRVTTQRMDVIFDLDDTLIRRGPKGCFTAQALPEGVDGISLRWHRPPTCPFGLLIGPTWIAEVSPGEPDRERRVLLAWRNGSADAELVVMDILVRRGWEDLKRRLADESRFTVFVASLGMHNYVQRVARYVLDPDGQLFKGEQGLRRIFSAADQGMRKSLGSVAAAVAGLPVTFGRDQEILVETVYAWPAGVIFDDWPDVWRGGQHDWVYRVRDFGVSEVRERGAAVLNELFNVLEDLHQRAYPPLHGGDDGGHEQGLLDFLAAESVEFQAALSALSLPAAGAALGDHSACAHTLVPALQRLMFASRRELVGRFAPLHQPGYELQAAAASGLLAEALFVEPFMLHGGSPGAPTEDLRSPLLDEAESDEVSDSDEGTPPPPASEPRTPLDKHEGQEMEWQCDAGVDGAVQAATAGGVARVLQMAGAKRKREEGEADKEGGGGRCSGGENQGPCSVHVAPGAAPSPPAP